MGLTVNDICLPFPIILYPDAQIYPRRFAESLLDWKTETRAIPGAESHAWLHDGRVGSWSILWEELRHIVYTHCSQIPMLRKTKDSGSHRVLGAWAWVLVL